MKKFDWTKWSAIAEIISGIAVVITLIFLIAGIQENTNVTRAAVYESSLDRLNDFDKTVIQDPELLQIWDRYYNGEAATLEALDEERLLGLIRLLFRTFENAYFNEQYELIGDAEWTRFQRSICGQYSILASQGMTGSVEAIVTSEFMEYMEASC